MKLIVKMASFPKKGKKSKEEAVDTPQAPEPELSSSALFMRNYRAKLKKDPTKYQLHRQLENHRSWLHRKQLSTEQKARYNEKAKLRMRKLREKKKAVGSGQDVVRRKVTKVTKSVKKTQRRVITEKQRTYWRTKKQAQRAGMSAQVRQSIREKDSQKKRDLRSAMRFGGFDSDEERWQAISRVKTVMSKFSANQYAEVVANLISTASREQLIALRKLGVTNLRK